MSLKSNQKSNNCQFDDVYSAEWEYIKQRREKINSSSSQEIPPNSQTGLIGLALSGGGIRSATFNLGLLQALANKGILRCCDYLSTVSGGGYIGSGMSSLLTNPNVSTEDDKFPLRNVREGNEERQEVSYLREHKNYLGSSKGGCSLDNCHAVGMALTGLVLINALSLSFLVLISLFLYVFEDEFYADVGTPFLLEKYLGFNELLLFIAGIVVLGVIVTRWWQQLSLGNSINPKLSIIYDDWIARGTKIAIILVVSVFLVRFIYSQAWNMFLFWASDWIEVSKNEGIGQFSYLFLAILVISIVIVIGGQIGLYESKIRRKALKTTMSVALVIFFLFLTVHLLSLMYYVEYKGRLLNVLLLSENKTVALTLPEIKLALRTEFTKNSSSNSDNISITEIFYWIIAGKEADLAKKANTIGTIYSNHRFIWECFSKAYKEQDGFFREALEEFKKNVTNGCSPDNTANKFQSGNFIDKLNQLDLERKQGFDTTKKYICCLFLSISGILFIIALLTNLNRISQHDFYRNRLSKTFLIRRKESVTGQHGEIENYCELRLRDLHEHHNGPYHLINTTLNIPTSNPEKNPSSKGRGADLFLFSKFYCGSESTGYQKTTEYDKGKTSLATAMAISGAAVSPEMGTTGTSSFVAVMATLLNMRLNLWMPNPKSNRKFRLILWPWYLLKELRRRGDEQDLLLNLSDGGHYENLGIYSLLKRRCQLIIASDAGADPCFQMSDLGNLKRKARIDLGIEIEFENLNDLLPNSKGYSKTPFVKGSIKYPDGEEGTLLYIKATLTGREPEDIRSYKYEHKTFPHQSTTDQFFDEQQFESYRKLGEWIGETVLINQPLI